MEIFISYHLYSPLSKSIVAPVVLYSHSTVAVVVSTVDVASKLYCPIRSTNLAELFVKEATKDFDTFDGWYKEQDFVHKVETLHGQSGDLLLYA